jgi:hypothetical protein
MLTMISPGLTRYLATGSASGKALSAGPVAVSSNGRLCVNGTAALVLYPWPRSLVARLNFFGNGADNDTFTAHLWAYEYTDRAMAGTEVLLHYLGNAACTLGAKVGLAGSPGVVNTERFADTITWTPGSESSTPKGPLAKWEAALNEGASAVYSPANDTVAELVLPCLGRTHGCVIEFAGVANGTLANALIRTGLV